MLVSLRSEIFSSMTKVCTEKAFVFNTKTQMRLCRVGVTIMKEDCDSKFW